MGTGGDASASGAPAALPGAAPPWRGQALGRSVPRRYLGWALVVAWVVWAVALWVVQPRLVPESTLADDLAAGRVTGYRAVTFEQEGPGLFSPSFRLDVWPASVPDEGDPGEQPTDGDSPDGSAPYDGPPRTVGYRVDAPVAAFRVLDPDRLSADAPTAQVQRLTTAGVATSQDLGFFSPPWQRVHNAGALLLLITFAVIVLGPRPGRGTRWFWFWLLPGPFLVVVPAFAVLELLRPRPDADGVGYPPGVAGRWSGLAGFVLGLLLWALLTGALTELSQRWPLWVVRG